MMALLNHQGPALAALDSSGRVTDLLGDVARSWKQIGFIWTDIGGARVYQTRSSMLLPRPESTFSLVAGGRTFYGGWDALLSSLGDLRNAALQLLGEYER